MVPAARLAPRCQAGCTIHTGCHIRTIFRWRVLRELAGGSIVTLGIFPTSGAAVAYATTVVLQLEDGPR
jgi:acyl CoA:acetate/3-ketoacid CoA transferase beta subunit